MALRGIQEYITRDVNNITRVEDFSYAEPCAKYYCEFNISDCKCLLSPKPISFIVIVTKYYIHCCYWLNKSPNTALLKWKFKQYEFIE